jgi:hypothetical protein
MQFHKHLNKRINRLIFTQFCFSSFFNNENIIDYLRIIRDEFEEYKDLDFSLLYSLNETLYANKQEIIQKVDRLNVDCQVKAILVAAFTEKMINNEPKLIISEYLKIADSFNVDYKFINGFLHENLVFNEVEQSK